MMRGGTLLIFGHGSNFKVIFGTLCIIPCGHDTDYKFPVFAQSLSNFTFKLRMIGGGTIWIFGHDVKGQGQLWHSVYKTSWTRY